MNFNRVLTEKIPKNYSSFIFGPRLTGKSTILRDIKSILYVDLLNTEEFLKYNVNPDYLFNYINGLKEKKGIVIIDEIQKIPLLLDVVQRIIDQLPGVYFILSGSSARKLKRQSVNLLGGRALNLALFPLSLQELGQTFSLDNVLTFGTLPSIYNFLLEKDFELAKNILRSYVTTYITQEIKEESLVRRLDGFQRFLSVAAFQNTQDINLDALSEEAKISPTATKNYYSILEDTLLGFFLYPYQSSIRKQLVKTPKFYFFDCGVVRAITQQLSNVPTNQERGLLFEQWIINEVRKINTYHTKDLSLNFWRTQNGSEVDLIISRGKEILLAVEIKHSSFPNQRDLKGLKSFNKDYNKVALYICAPVDKEYILEDRYRVIRPESLMQIVLEL